MKFDTTRIIGVHPRPICVEKSCDLYPDPMLAMIIKKERLGTSFPLIVTGPSAKGIDICPQ